MIRRLAPSVKSERGPPPEAAAVLAWYDRHRRRLPWRALPGEAPDPYRVWLSEVMLQQTTVPAVKAYYEKFLTLWPDVQALAAATDDEVMSAWAGLGYYSRARNLLACARVVVTDHGAEFPSDERALRGLPGIGDYTAAAIAAIAFGQRAVVVDANIERVMARYAAIKAPLPGAKPAIRAATDRVTPDQRAGDFAQALMDLGATICTPKRPACALCPLNEGCVARREGIAEMLPVKPAKAPRPTRRGAAFVLCDRAGRLLVRTRPPKGLLGAMTEVPGTEWTTAADQIDASGAPLAADYRHAGVITHVFTHFALELTVFSAHVADVPAPPGMRWMTRNDIGAAAFPTVFRKVLARAFGDDGKSR